jgi:hypothetical protein
MNLLMYRICNYASKENTSNICVKFMTCSHILFKVSNSWSIYISWLSHLITALGSPFHCFLFMQAQLPKYISTGFVDTKSILSNLVWCKFSVFLFICCQIPLLQAQKYYFFFSRLSFEPLIMCKPYCVWGLHHLLFLHRSNCSNISIRIYQS